MLVLFLTTIAIMSPCWTRRFACHGLAVVSFNRLLQSPDGIVSFALSPVFGCLNYSVYARRKWGFYVGGSLRSTKLKLSVGSCGGTWAPVVYLDAYMWAHYVGLERGRIGLTRQAIRDWIHPFCSALKRPPVGLLSSRRDRRVTRFP